MRPIIKMLGSYPIAQKAWTLDQFLSSSIEKLNSGKVIMFFPEGKIINDGRKERPRPGIGYLAEKSGRPVLPLHIQWRSDNFGRKQITLSFGKAISFQSEDHRLSSYRKEAENIMNIIYSL